VALRSRQADSKGDMPGDVETGRRAGLLQLLTAGGSAGTEQATRALAVSTALLLTLGVITVGLMGDGKAPPAVRGAHSGGSVASTPSVITQLAGSGTPAPPSAAAGPGAGGLALPTVNPAVPAGTPPILGSPPPPAGTPPPPGGAPGAPRPTPPPPTQAPLQLALGANAGVATFTVAAAVGGGCTGASIDGSPSCAPSPPASPGVHVDLRSPLGHIEVAIPPAGSTGGQITAA
jgi:hypothetical protein